MQMTVITHHQTTTVIHPSETALDFPALAVALPCFYWTTALRMFTLASLKGRDRRLNATSTQFAPQFRTIKAFVGHHFFRSGFRTSAFLRHANSLERGLCQRDFM